MGDFLALYIFVILSITTTFIIFTAVEILQEFLDNNNPDKISNLDHKAVDSITSTTLNSLKVAPSLPPPPPPPLPPVLEFSSKLVISKSKSAPKPKPVIGMDSLLDELKTRKRMITEFELKMGFNLRSPLTKRKRIPVESFDFIGTLVPNLRFFTR